MPQRRNRCIQLVVCRECRRGTIWTRLVFWCDAQPWMQALLALRPDARITVEGGRWVRQHSRFGVVTCASTPCVARAEWHNAEKWNIGQGVQLVPCSLECEGPAHPPSASPWSPLELLLSQAPQMPLASRPSVSPSRVSSFAIGLHLVHGGAQRLFLTLWALDVVASVVSRW